MMPSKAIKLVEDNESSMTNFDLSNSTVWQMKTTEYVAKLCEALKTNTNVKEVHLQNCLITDSAAAQFAAVLKVNEHITELDLGNNKITSQGLVSLAVGLAHNNTLKHLILIGQNSRFGEASLACVVKMFETNTTLTKITWRLDSKQAWAITRACTRNVEIERRLAEGMSVDNLDPNLKRERDSAAGLSQDSSKTPFARDFNTSSGGSKSVILRKPSAGRLKSPRRRNPAANDEKITKSPMASRARGGGRGAGRGGRGGGRGGGGIASAKPAAAPARTKEEKTPEPVAPKKVAAPVKEEVAPVKEDAASAKEAAPPAKVAAPAPKKEAASAVGDALAAERTELKEARAAFEKERSSFAAEKSAFEAERSAFQRKREAFKRDMQEALNSI